MKLSQDAATVEGATVTSTGYSIEDQHEQIGRGKLWHDADEVLIAHQGAELC